MQTNSIIRQQRVLLVEVLEVQLSTFAGRPSQYKLEARRRQQPTTSFRLIVHYVLFNAYRMERRLLVVRFNANGNSSHSMNVRALA